MSRVDAEPEAWQPRTAEDRDAILRELQSILASPQFCNSKRYPALLEYIVKNTLAGKAELLKERTLGVDVFHRPATYDTNSDTVVRYTAGEVRKRLLLYYSEHSRNATVRIYLPAGSYIPEFFHGPEDPEQSDPEDLQELAIAVAGRDPVPDRNAHPQLAVKVLPEAVPPPAVRRRWRIWASATTFVVVIALAALWWWNLGGLRPQPAIDAFWAPVLHDSRPVMMCTGSVVFASNNYSGVTTAGRDLDYTFVSMQIASAIAQISDVAVSSGAKSQLVFSATTPLTELRERPLILLGAYNNRWTLRLLDPLRFHFAPEPDEKILDRSEPARSWVRDHSQPYASADDYAVVARFRDPTLDSWVIALAGLGRNGTEAAAQFATSPHYLDLLRRRLGRDFPSENLEVVLKVNVIDGKSGAPAIMAVHAW
jgi:hypothetical protein